MKKVEVREMEMEKMEKIDAVEMVKKMVEKILQDRDWVVGFAGEVLRDEKILDEIMNELETADKVIICEMEDKRKKITVEHYRTSWLARYRRISRGYVIAKEIENIKTYEAERQSEDDDFDVIYEYHTVGDYIVVEVQIDNFDDVHEFRKTVWVHFTPKIF